MKQSRMMSLVESFANVAVGYGVAVATQILVFPLFGLEVLLGQNLLIGVIFTVVSIARSFALRRVFEEIRARQGREAVSREANRKAQDAKLSVQRRGVPTDAF